MPALPQRLRDELAAAMTELGQLGAACGDFVQGAARACNGASQHLYEHPWGAESHTAAKLLRPRTIGNLFSNDRVPNGHNLMDQAAMETFAMGGKSAFAGGLAAPGGQIPLAVFPPQALLPALFDASVRRHTKRCLLRPFPVV